MEDRVTEKARLEEIPPLVTEIHSLRKELELPLREFEDEELTGPTNVEDRTKERDDLLARVDHLRALQPLIDELQGLRKQLGMPSREFEEGELDADDADVMLQKEIDDLKKVRGGGGLMSQTRLSEADNPQTTNSSTDHLPTTFTTTPPQMLNRRDEADALAKEIQGLRKQLDMPKRVFTEEELDSREAVPKLTVERDDLQVSAR